MAVPSPLSWMSYEPVCAFCMRDGLTSCHSIREMSAEYSYARMYSSCTTPASMTKRTWLAYPSSYSSTTSTDRAAETHSGYRGKSQMTSAIRAGAAPITIDCMEVSAMLRRLPRGRHRRTGRLAAARCVDAVPRPESRAVATMLRPQPDGGARSRYVFLVRAWRSSMRGPRGATRRGELEETTPRTVARTDQG